ncbi:hypothetical protein HBH46_119550 [Parastagonospora nodorum]|nr:hypothetical protein HBH46_119550 [Parastagonospora nodorum]
MAPSTRLRANPTRRVLYAESTGREGSRGNPIALEDTPPPEPVTSPAPRKRAARKPAGKQPALTVPRTRGGAIVKPKESSEKATGKKEKKKKAPPVKRECSLCASTKGVATCFRLDGHEDACEHFENTCGQCIQKMISVKISQRQLGEAELACPVPGCAHVLDYTTLKHAFTNKALFVDFDKALVKHLLSASPTFIACLSPMCGKYFSTDTCIPTSRSTKQQISCPYCASSLYLTCNRPWHPRTGCNSAAAAEDASSLAQIKSMGAKPCPQCGVNIEKSGGCDHMTCHRCRHGFCWVCLVPYTVNVVHAEGCPHGRRDVAVDPRNWVPEGMGEEQVNALIEHAGRRLDGVGGQVGFQPVPMPQAQAQAQAPWGQFVVGGMANAFFNFIAGGQGGPQGGR